MKNIIGKPNALKQVNLSVVRKAIKERGSATRAEIAAATQISVTTIRTLLTEMQTSGEVTDIGLDESIGGRKAVRYQLNADRFFGVALLLDGENIRYLIVNICGEIKESGSFPARGDTNRAVCLFLDELFAKTEIKSIGFGVPGIVKGMIYQRKNNQGSWESYALGEVISARYNVPVILENDLNAAVLGFGRRYLKQYPDTSCENIHAAYVHFDKGCISAGFLSHGRILRGCNNFVGELGLFPVSDSKTLDDLFVLPLEESRYSDIAAKMLAGICCVLNPSYIAIGGEHFCETCLPLIIEKYNSMLPKEMRAKIVCSGDIWDNYFEGMAYLTAEQIFADLLIIKEQVWDKS